MVDRIDKLDPKSFLVQDSLDGQKRQSDEPAEEENTGKEERDKFEKKGKDLQKFLPNISAPMSGPAGKMWGAPAPAASEAPEDLAIDAGDDKTPVLIPKVDDEDEPTVSFSRRLLFIWGMVNVDGKPSPKVIATYASVTLVILTAFILMIRILWP